jgi:hypothetical protein
MLPSPTATGTLMAFTFDQMTTRILFFICALLVYSMSQAAEQNDAPPAPAGLGVLKSLPEAMQNLLHYATNFKGISYKRGGTNPESGFDCSGFVRYVFDRIDGLSLPHSSKALSQIGDRIVMAELHPGDLVFFSFMHTISHVGIYLGNDQFIHASSTRTGIVMVSSLTDDYWAKHFTLARRIAPSVGAVSSSMQPALPSNVSDR